MNSSEINPRLSNMTGTLSISIMSDLDYNRGTRRKAIDLLWGVRNDSIQEAIESWLDGNKWAKELPVGYIRWTWKYSENGTVRQAW